jgi:hypothetical protein
MLQHAFVQRRCWGEPLSYFNQPHEFFPETRSQFSRNVLYLAITDSPVIQTRMGSPHALCFSEKSNHSLQIVVRRITILDNCNGLGQSICAVLFPSIKQVCWGIRKALEVVLANPDDGAIPSIYGHPSGLQLPPVARDVGASSYVDMLGS